MKKTFTLLASISLLFACAKTTQQTPNLSTPKPPPFRDFSPDEELFRLIYQHEPPEVGWPGYIYSLTPTNPTDETPIQRIPVPTNVDLFAIWGDTSTNTELFVSGRGGTILHYKDKTWTQETTNTQATIYSLLKDGDAFFAAGDNGTLLRRRDNAWSPINANTIRTIHALFASNNALYAAGDGGLILQSKDHGDSWSYVHNGGPNLLTIAGDKTLYSAGDSGFIMKSTNNGASWSLFQKGDVSAFVSSNNTIYAAGDNGTVLRSKDGTTWTELSKPANQTIRALTVDVFDVQLAGERLSAFSSNEGNSWSASAGEYFSYFAVERFNGGLFYGSDKGIIKPDESRALDGSVLQEPIYASYLSEGNSPTIFFVGSQELARHMTAARRAIVEKDLASAIKEIEAARPQTEERWAEPLLNAAHAELQRRQGELSEADKEFSLLLRSMDTTATFSAELFARLWYQRGLTQEEGKNKIAALEFFSVAQQISPHPDYQKKLDELVETPCDTVREKLTPPQYPPAVYKDWLSLWNGLFNKKTGHANGVPRAASSAEAKELLCEQTGCSEGGPWLVTRSEYEEDDEGNVFKDTAFSHLIVPIEGGKLLVFPFLFEQQPGSGRETLLPLQIASSDARFVQIQREYQEPIQPSFPADVFGDPKREESEHLRVDYIFDIQQKKLILALDRPFYRLDDKLLLTTKLEIKSDHIEVTSPGCRQSFSVSK